MTAKIQNSFVIQISEKNVMYDDACKLCKYYGAVYKIRFNYKFENNNTKYIYLLYIIVYNNNLFYYFDNYYCHNNIILTAIIIIITTFILMLYVR